MGDVSLYNQVLISRAISYLFRVPLAKKVDDPTYLSWDIKSSFGTWCVGCACVCGSRGKDPTMNAYYRLYPQNP